MQFFLANYQCHESSAKIRYAISWSRIVEDRSWQYIALKTNMLKQIIISFVFINHTNQNINEIDWKTLLLLKANINSSLNA